MSSTVHPLPKTEPGPAPTYPMVAPAQPAYPPAYTPPAYPAAGSQPPQPAPYYQYNQPTGGQYNQPAVGQPVVVVQQPTLVVGTALPRFGQSSIWLVCPNCHNNVQTKVYYKVGGFTWLVAAILFFVGLSLGCCLIPFCINSCKDAEHICPSCGRMVGKYHRM